MRWYSTLKSFLFANRRTFRAQPARRRRDSPDLLPHPQTALIGGALDRRAIRLRRD